MLLIAFGTRPEWIKIKPLIKKLQATNIKYMLLYTGQHKDLIDSEYKDYGNIYSIDISNNSNNRLDNIVSSIVSGFREHAASHVLVQGDTTTALAVAMSAFHHGLEVIHLEAGLRTFDIQNPYPEEANRQAITSFASIHFCPTWDDANNVVQQKASRKGVYVTGNTVLDNLVGLKPTIEPTVLVTLHRRENIPNIIAWFRALEETAKMLSHLNFIFPMHPNPEIQKYKYILEHIHVIDPLPHEKCVELIRKCRFVITDSGGIQEEASFFKKRAVVCRKVTERCQGIGSFSILCTYAAFLPADVMVINDESDELVNIECPYGDGHASEKICEILGNIL